MVKGRSAPRADRSPSRLPILGGCSRSACEAGLGGAVVDHGRLIHSEDLPMDRRAVFEDHDIQRDRWKSSNQQTD